MGLYLKGFCCEKGCAYITEGACHHTPKITSYPQWFWIEALGNFSYVIQASGGGTMVFGSSTLPASITLNSSTGVLEGYFSGLPRRETITLYATNDCGIGSANLIIDIRDAAPPPCCGFSGIESEGEGCFFSGCMGVQTSWDVTGQFDCTTEVYLVLSEMNLGTIDSIDFEIYGETSGLLFITECFTTTGQSSAFTIPSGTTRITVRSSFNCRSPEEGQASYSWGLYCV